MNMKSVDCLTKDNHLGTASLPFEELERSWQSDVALTKP